MARRIPATRPRAPRKGGHGLAASGFTLAEALIASVVLATAVAGLAGALSVSSSQSQLMDVDCASLALARQLMEQVLARPFDPPATGDHPGWKAGGRSYGNYDDIADFDGFSDVCETPSSANGGAVVAGNVTFRRSVSVTRRATPGGPPAANGDFAMIAVSVAPDAPGCGPITLYRMVARYPVAR